MPFLFISLVLVAGGTHTMSSVLVRLPSCYANTGITDGIVFGVIFLSRFIHRPVSKGTSRVDAAYTHRDAIEVHYWPWTRFVVGLNAHMRRAPAAVAIVVGALLLLAIAIGYVWRAFISMWFITETSDLLTTRLEQLLYTTSLPYVFGYILGATLASMAPFSGIRWRAMVLFVVLSTVVSVLEHIGTSLLLCISGALVRVWLVWLLAMERRRAAVRDRSIEAQAQTDLFERLAPTCVLVGQTLFIVFGYVEMKIPGPALACLIYGALAGAVLCISETDERYVRWRSKWTSEDHKEAAMVAARTRQERERQRTKRDETAANIPVKKKRRRRVVHLL